MRYQRSLEIEQRLQTVLELIQSGRFSTRGLADQVRVSIPTISRCVEALRERGHDIRAVRTNRVWRYVLKSAPPKLPAGSRRQQVIPLQPSSWGRSSQRMPEHSTNKIPRMATLFNTRGRPPSLPGASSGGSNGSISNHSSSGNDACDMFHLRVFGNSDPRRRLAQMACQRGFVRGSKRRSIPSNRDFIAAA